MHGNCDDHERFCEQTAENCRLRMALKIAVRRLGGSLMLTPNDWAAACYDDIAMHETAGGINVKLTARYPEGS